MNNSTKIVSLAVLLLGLLGLAAGSLQANVIVADGFSGTDGDAINNRTPDGPNLPQGTWYSVGDNNDPDRGYPNGNNPFRLAPGHRLKYGENEAQQFGVYLAAKLGGYTKPPQFWVSEDVEVGTIGGDTLGVGIAFSPNEGTFLPAIAVTLGANGNLNFDGNTIAGYNAADFSNQPFDPNTFYHLSFGVNTVSGGVSDLTLSNGFGIQTYSLSTVLFTGAQTAFVGIFSNDSVYGDTPTANTGNIDNFLVMVPEPASMALLAGGSLLLLRRRKCG